MKTKINKRKYFVGNKKLKHVKLYEEFDINENYSREVSAAMGTIEEFVEHEFVKKDLLGGAEINYNVSPEIVGDYVVDSEEVRSSEGKETKVWLEVYLGEDKMKEVNKELNSNYDKFVKPFVEWAKSKDLYYPSVLSTDDTITFEITVL